MNKNLRLRHEKAMAILVVLAVIALQIIVWTVAQPPHPLPALA